MKRRDFVKTLSATGVALYASDLVGDLIAQSPKARVMDSRFKGLSDVALNEAKRLGCTYADIRFTRNVNDSVGGPRPHRHRLVRLRRRRHGDERRLRRPRDPQRRVGLCQQPVRHRGGDQEDHRAGDRSGQGQRGQQALRSQARAGRGVSGLLGGAGEAEARGRLARRQDRVPDEDQRGRAQGAGRDARAVEHGVRLRVEVPGHVGGLVHRAGNLAHLAGLHRDRAQGRQGQVAHLLGGAEVGRLRSGARREDARERRAHRAAKRSNTAPRRRSASASRT